MVICIGALFKRFNSRLTCASSQVVKLDIVICDYGL
jgi:hypothetical protein